MLFKLPAELRDYIYELVYEDSSEEAIDVTDAFPGVEIEADSRDELDGDYIPCRSSIFSPAKCPMRGVASAVEARSTPLSSAPPSSALLRTCQRLHMETRNFFPQAYTLYWQKTFIIDLEKTPDSLKHVCRFPTLPMDSFLVRWPRTSLADPSLLSATRSTDGPINFRPCCSKGQ